MTIGLLRRHWCYDAEALRQAPRHILIQPVHEGPHIRPAADIAEVGIFPVLPIYSGFDIPNRRRIVQQIGVLEIGIIFLDDLIRFRLDREDFFKQCDDVIPFIRCRQHGLPSGLHVDIVGHCDDAPVGELSHRPFILGQRCRPNRQDSRCHQQNSFDSHNFTPRFSQTVTCSLYPMTLFLSKKRKV